MHQSDNQCLLDYHLYHGDIIIAAYVKSGTTMKFGLLSLFNHYLEASPKPVVLVYFVNVTRR
jgi:hypothetical protein